LHFTVAFSSFKDRFNNFPLFLPDRCPSCSFSWLQRVVRRPGLQLDATVFLVGSDRGYHGLLPSSVSSRLCTCAGAPFYRRLTPAVAGTCFLCPYTPNSFLTSHLRCPPLLFFIWVTGDVSPQIDLPFQFPPIWWPPTVIETVLKVLDFPFCSCFSVPSTLVSAAVSSPFHPPPRPLAGMWDQRP